MQTTKGSLVIKPNRNAVRRTAAGLLAGVVAASALVACSPESSEPTDLSAYTGLSEFFEVEPTDEALPLAVTYSQTGSESGNGELIRNGIELAQKHLAAEGFDYELTYHDNKSGDPQAGINAMRQIAASDTAQHLCSFICDLGAQLPAIEQNQVLSIDGAGGTGNFAQGKPYFYGARIVIPDDMYPGLFEWLAVAQPDATRIGHVTWDLGESSDKSLDASRTAIEEGGFEVAAHEKVAVHTQDFAGVVRQLESSNPDVVILSLLDSVDIGAFLSQFRATNKDAIVVSTTQFDETVSNVSGIELSDYYFSYDLFDPTNPPSDFARFFAEAYEAEYGEPAGALAASFYEDVLIHAALVDRVRADGGDPRNGAELLAALEKLPEFISVFGGDGEQPGSIVFDLDTHSVASRTAGVYRLDGASVTPVATFDISGADFTLLAE